MTSLNEKSTSLFIAKITFLLYLFFIFFGTSMPFRPRVEAVDEIGTSNFVNQLVFSTLFLLSLIAIYPKKQQLLKLIKVEKFLTILLIWSLFSLLWSDYSFTSFKRLFQIFSSVFVILSFLLNVDEPDESLKYFRAILYLYIPLTFISILLIPGATDPIHQSWRGLAVHKNYLGQAAVVSIIICAYSLKSGTLKMKLIYLLLLISSLVLLFGSRSMTSILTFLLITLLYSFFSFDRLFRSLGIGKTYSILIIICFSVILLSIYHFNRDIIASAFLGIGKDITFTGRTELWKDLFSLVKERLFFGFGFAGFWVVHHDNVQLMKIYEKYVWLPNEAHSGYLDLLMQLGLIGLFIFILMLFFYFRNIVKFRTAPFGFWLLISTLILNFQESTLFFPRILTGDLLIFAYLLLFAQIIKINNFDHVSA